MLLFENKDKIVIALINQFHFDYKFVIVIANCTLLLLLIYIFFNAVLQALLGLKLFNLPFSTKKIFRFCKAKVLIFFPKNFYSEFNFF